MTTSSKIKRIKTISSKTTSAKVNPKKSNNYLLVGFLSLASLCLYVFLVGITSQTVLIGGDFQLPTATPNPVVGQDVQVGDYRWRVIKVQDKGNTLHPPNRDFLDMRTPGRFLWVRFEVEKVTGNRLGKATYVENSTLLVDNQGKKFEVSEQVFRPPAMGLIPEEEWCAFTMLELHTPHFCQVFFEVPLDSKGLKLRVEDIGGGTHKQEAYIELYR